MPHYKIQIIHIEGDNKGDINTFFQNAITFGRNPECDVIFNPNGLLVSRMHAKIALVGDQFALQNLGTNGCYVNGQKQDRIILKQGDVIMFANGGPKVSFLFEPCEPPTDTPLPIRPSRSANQHQPATKLQSAPRPFPATVNPSPLSSKKEAGEFTIQFGSVIKSFIQPTIYIGKHSTDDFQIENPEICDKHLEISFSNNQYFIRNANKSAQTTIDGMLLQSKIKLEMDCVIAIEQNGPKLRYLGNGKFSEFITTTGANFDESVNYKHFDINSRPSLKPSMLNVVKSAFFNKK